MARLAHDMVGPDEAPVVLLGGALGSARGMWGAQVEALSGRYRVVAFDHRGHGDSEVPDGPYTIGDLGADVVGLLDELGVAKASYAGISLGGMVGLWLAQNAGDRFQRFVLLCAEAVPGGGSQMWTDRAAQVRAEGTAAIADATIGRWFKPGHPDTDTIRQQLLDTPDEGYAGCCEAIGAMDQRAGLAGITAPVLMVGSDGDESIPAQNVLATAQQIPGARFELIEDAAHLVAVSHPGRVTELIAEHLS